MNITKYRGEGTLFAFVVLRSSVLIANDRGNAVSTVAKVAKSGFLFVSIYKYLWISINRISPTWGAELSSCGTRCNDQSDLLDAVRVDIYKH